jgi:adenylate cyclase
MPFAHRIQSRASEDRLEKLIAERLKPGAVKEQIDSRIWDLLGEEWSVMFTDLSGFSRHTAKFGIIHFLQIIYESQRVFFPIIDKHDGILLKTEGDSLMVIFKNPTKAIECAISMQRASKVYNETKPEEEKILVCIGIGFGKMLRIGDDDVYGAEVNAASKLGEDTAKAWEIMITENAKKAADGKTKDVTFEQLSEIPSGANAAFKVNYKL